MSLTTPPFLTPPLDSEPSVTTDYAPPSVKSCEDFVCLWNNCYRTFNDAELLYLHLANDHVGRKSTGNLCLVCHWDGCGTSSKKRDHITSHLRVHVSSKPHTCERCSKSFKRPQDLKKHERTHTSQHQKKIYDSKFTRIKNQPLTPPQLLPDDSPGTSTSPSPQLPCSPSSVSSGLPAYNYYPIPHQDMSQFSDGSGLEHSLFDDYVKLKPSQKRSMDVFEGFYQDVKKQRINPKYNGDLISKLEDVSNALDTINVDQASLPPSLRKIEDFTILEDFFEQALKEVESPYTIPLYAPTNLGYSWGNPIDSGDSSCNFPNSTVSIGNVYPTTYEYVNTLSTLGGNTDDYCHNPRQLDNFINNDPSFDAEICYMTQYKKSPAKESSSVTTSTTSEDSTDIHSASSHKDRVIETVSDEDIVKKLSTLNIDDNKPIIETSNYGALKEREKYITLINSIRRKVAVFSRQLNGSSVKLGEDATQPNASSNHKNSLPTQPISGDKLNLEADSLVVVE